jgi:hypothetical protein
LTSQESNLKLDTCTGTGSDKRRHQPGYKDKEVISVQTKIDLIHQIPVSNENMKAMPFAVLRIRIRKNPKLFDGSEYESEKNLDSDSVPTIRGWIKCKHMLYW